MKEAYKHFGSHFIKIHTTTKEGFDSINKLYAAWYKKFLPLNKNAKILDLGCGMGHFMYFLEKEGYRNFFGIDISKELIDFVEKNISKNVAVADAFDFLRKEELFELIIMNDILEHIPKKRLLELLHLVFNSLDKDGIVFIKVPNMSNPFSLRTRYVTITHEIGFTERSLPEVLRMVGFQDIQTIGTLPPPISIKLLIKRIGATLVYIFLRLLFKIQDYPAPKILTNHIIAIAKKK